MRAHRSTSRAQTAWHDGLRRNPLYFGRSTIAQDRGPGSSTKARSRAATAADRNAGARYHGAGYSWQIRAGDVRRNNNAGSRALAVPSPGTMGSPEGLRPPGLRLRTAVL